jgi:hypothetical protein
MVAEGAGRECPTIRQDRKTPGRIVRLGEFVWVEQRGREGRSALGKLRHAKRAMDGLSARRLAGGDALESEWEDEAKHCPLGGRAKDTGAAG